MIKKLRSLRTIASFVMKSRMLPLASLTVGAVLTFSKYSTLERAHAQFGSQCGSVSNSQESCGSVAPDGGACPMGTMSTLDGGGTQSWSYALGNCGACGGTYEYAQPYDDPYCHYDCSPEFERACNSGGGFYNSQTCTCM